MDNFVQRFRNKDILPTEITIPLAVGEDTFQLTVARFAQEEMNAARKTAEREARERGARPGDLQPDENLQLFALALAPFVFRHVKGWKHVPAPGTSEIEYQPDIAKGLFAEMSENELAAVGIGYILALQALREAGKKKDTSPT